MTRDPVPNGREATRRRFAVGAAVLGLAGCLGRDRTPGTTTSRLNDSRVTTTSGDRVEVVRTRMVNSEDAHGPRASHRLRNAGDADATVSIRTVLRVDGGGTYEGTAYADVPAGDEVVVGYRVATWEELGEADAERVRRRAADFDVYVNGEHRPNE